MLIKYNELLDDFPTAKAEHEANIACDMLLDIFRHKSYPLLDVLNLVSDFKTSIKKGTGFTLKQFLSRV